MIKLGTYAKRLAEDTDLRGVVAKFESEQDAIDAVGVLKNNNIDARYTKDVTFNTGDTNPSWGVLVRAEDVECAGRTLDNSKVQGAEFDPYTHIE